MLHHKVQKLVLAVSHVKVGLKANIFLLLVFGFISIFLFVIFMGLMYSMIVQDQTISAVITSVLALLIIMLWYWSAPAFSTYLVLRRIMKKQWNIVIQNKKLFIISYTLNLVGIIVFAITNIGYGLTFIAFMSLGNFHSGHRKYLRVIEWVKNRRKSAAENSSSVES